MTVTQEDMSTEVERLRAELAEATATADRYDPTRDVSGHLFETTDDVRAFFSHEHLVDIALDEWGAENIELLRRGRQARPEPTGKELEKRVDRVVEALLRDRTGSVKQRGYMLRVVKMVKPNGQLVQIPLEGQINSFRTGGAERAFAPYRAKGYKIAKPYLCQSRDCWLEAEVAKDGTYAYDGYCTPNHRDRTEPDDPNSDRLIRPLQI